MFIQIQPDGGGGEGPRHGIDRPLEGVGELDERRRSPSVRASPASISRMRSSMRARDERQARHDIGDPRRAPVEGAVEVVGIAADDGDAGEALARAGGRSRGCTRWR